MKKKNNAVLVLGLFDSMHLGHRYLIDKAKKFAEENRLNLILLTFDDNFFEFINIEQKNLYTLDERIRIIKKLDLNYYVIESKKEFFALDDKGFYNFLSKFKPSAIFAGSDYTYGIKGKWTVTDLKAYYKNYKVDVNIIDLLNVDNEKVSTTRIKELILNGNVLSANKLLIDRYFAIGKVIHGRGVGCTLGIPTANFVTSSNKLLPKWGVYATNAIIDGITYKSITNVGNQPTFDSKNINVETHILDYNGDIYGKEIIIEFKQRLRDIKCFESVNDLRENIMIDIERAKGL